MLARKCDICGAEMRITTPRYKVTFDGWTYTEEVDICVDCFERIAEEIKQADTPQTDEEITKNSLRTDCNGCKFVGWYDTDFPCVNCIRKNKDYYSPEQTKERSE